MMTTGPRDLDDVLNPSRIQPETIDAIQRYIHDGLPPGGFLEAVLANDLMDACKRADRHSLHALVAIVGYVYNHVPMTACGSRDIVKLRIEIGSATRLQQSDAYLNQLREALAFAVDERRREAAR